MELDHVLALADPLIQVNEHTSSTTKQSHLGRTTLCMSPNVVTCMTWQTYRADLKADFSKQIMSDAVKWSTVVMVTCAQFLDRTEMFSD